MWRNETREYEMRELPKVIEFTGCHISYGSAMMEVVENWKYCIHHHLTDNSINKRAYIGHAACNYKFGWPEYLVRMAWNQLTDKQRYLANKQADNAIEYFLKNNNYATQTQIRIECF
jgi:hypothetical protein